MSTERFPALLIADDSAVPLRLEIDKDLYLCLNQVAAVPFAGIARANAKLYKAVAGDVRSIQFRIGEPDANDTGDGATTLGFYIQHNSSGELEIFSASGKGMKINSTGDVEFSGDAGFPQILTGTVNHDPPSIAALSHYNFNISVPGALTANQPSVALGWDIQLATSLTVVQAWVSAADTVTVRLLNLSTGSAIDMGVFNCRATVFQY